MHNTQCRVTTIKMWFHKMHMATILKPYTRAVHRVLLHCTRHVPMSHGLGYAIYGLSQRRSTCDVQET
ncbi:hypothetical protein NP493_603g01022 [Ridgeia piscesae]|uniref:Uncharacterized protein n=1 Tax=Ridgeia piscesae TaxID=27915 RepID=A0AAD9KTQ8_RIDPI|nr:hypothetical protein NP493_603g01022 [Ridgeia piscesae]